MLERPTYILNVLRDIGGEVGGMMRHNRTCWVNIKSLRQLILLSDKTLSSFIMKVFKDQYRHLISRVLQNTDWVMSLPPPQKPSPVPLLR